MVNDQPAVMALRGFFTSQRWLQGRTLRDMELLIGFQPGFLTTRGAAVYGLVRIPENWEFELQGYTNVSGGLDMSPEWRTAEARAEEYYKRTGMLNASTRLKNNARASMAVSGPNRLVKVVPLLAEPNARYPPGRGIPQWRISKLAEQKCSVFGTLLVVLKPGDSYPMSA